MFAMVTVRAEEHDDGTMMFLYVIFCQVGGAIQLQQVKGRNSRKNGGKAPASPAADCWGRLLLDRLLLDRPVVVHVC